MAGTPPPVRELGPREYVGGFALMAMGFGAYSWTNGRDIAWGAQQTFGAISFGVGVAAGLVAYLWPRGRG